MSNHLVSQPLSISGTKTGQLEHIPNRLEPSMPVVQMGLMGLVQDNPASQKQSVPNQQMGFMGPVSKGLGLQKLSTLGNYDRQDQSRDKVVGSQQYMFSPKTLEVVNMLNNQGSPHLLVTNKRKAPTESIGDLSPQSSSIPFKRATQMEHRPWLLQPAASRKVMPGQSMQQAPGVKQLPGQTKKLTQMESISPKPTSQRAATLKGQTPGQSSAKGVSFDSVRSKMRESLAAALALVSQEGSKPPTSAEHSQGEALFMLESTSGTQTSASNTAPVNTIDNQLEEPKQALLSGEGSNDQKLFEDHKASQEAPGINTNGSPALVLASNIQDFQSDNALSTDDVPFSDHFFVKDELLQGNGLSWALESDIGVEETVVIQPMEEKYPLHEQVEGMKNVVNSPEELAFKIEAELYKLFGGVNKKYKEKGRSLLFNLKDRSNPELRERVVSGEIPPERLCSMTAEELASKELSEWRIAKAEELAQMVVLPDSEVDVRRLVKKTHKGEFQVEVEQDDSVSVEVSLGGSSISQSRPRPKEESPQRRQNEIKEGNARGGRSGTLDKGADYTLTLPSDGQESEVDIMVDDAIADLPPIVSLDEFMESLDSEPPFEDLQAGAGKTESQSPGKDLQVGSALESSERSPKVADDALPDKSGKVDETLSTSSVDEKSSGSQGKSESRLSPVISKGEQVWEGHLQLNTSFTVSVLGGFKSGERTSAKQWNSVVEIKGRVRLDAFEKFLQDLRMSRSRAIMVVHFLCKNGSSESERANICEVADSYVLDERVGFAEPSKGVELYFCPPHASIRDILGKILPKDQSHALDSVDSGLIGVVIWRRTQFTSAAIEQSSASKKQLATTSTTKSRLYQDKFDSSAMNPYQSSQFSSSARMPTSCNVVNGGGVKNDDNDDDDEDVPPGFGPAHGASRDIDDLPEFNFSGGGSDPMAARSDPQFGSNPSRVPSRPVDQIRDLIHKYGHSGVEPGHGKPGVRIQPWNGDDDDIPEWQPDGLGQRFEGPGSQMDVGNQHLAGQQDQVVYPSTGQVARPTMQHRQPASWSSPGDRGGQFYEPPRGRAAAWRQGGHKSGGY